MGRSFNKKSSLFQIDYQAPFGGLDSTAYASAISEHNFPSMSQIFNESNTLKPMAPVLLRTFTSLGGNYLGFIPVTFDTTIGYVVTNSAVYKVALTGGSLTMTLAGSYTPAELGTGNGEFSYLVINQIASDLPDIYWTQNGWDEIWQLTGGIVSQLTGYVGGGYLGLLNNQMLNLGGISAADGPVPNRISWSAPGQYGQWQPYDVGTGTGNYAAGFNDLPSTSDIITGFIAIGTVGYIQRSQGVTQMSPTGTGLVPFTFNHLWASELGVGTAYPDSLSQYGPTSAFIGNSAIYSLGLSGLSELGQSAKKLIFSLLNKTFALAGGGTAVQGRVVPFLWSEPALTYVLAIPYGTIGANDNVWKFIGIDILTSNVYDLGSINTGNWASPGFLVNCQIGYFDNYNLFNPLVPNSEQFICPFIAMASLGGTTVSFYAFAPTGVTGTVVFKKEQLGILQNPSVSKLLVLGSLIDTTQDGSISWSVDGGNTFNAAFKDTIITHGIGNPGNGIIDDIVCDGMQTLERPQLSLRLNNVAIVQAWMQGTLADFEPI